MILEGLDCLPELSHFYCNTRAVARPGRWCFTGQRFNHNPNRRVTRLFRLYDRMMIAKNGFLRLCREWLDRRVRWYELVVVPGYRVQLEFRLIANCSRPLLSQSAY